MWNRSNDLSRCAGPVMFIHCNFDELRRHFEPARGHSYRFRSCAEVHLENREIFMSIS